MQILLLSDIHDNVWALQTILHSPYAAAANMAICCGDLCSPFMLDLLARFNKPVHTVLGNNDGDVEHMTAKLEKYPHLHIHGEYYRDELDNTTIAVNHYPEKAEQLVRLQAYDLVCYGHDHAIFAGKKDKTLLLNPGAVMGFSPRQLRDIPASFMLYDTRNRAVTAFRFGKDEAVTRWDPYCLTGAF